MRKNILKYTFLIFLIAACGSCRDFMNVDTDNVLDNKDYIDEESEMYAGYIGVITKIQAIGDKIIYLTDTRAEMLGPTVNTTDELYALYNYDSDLEGNLYANPAAYYDVIIACNDYLQKLYAYKTENPTVINMEHYQALVSSTLRIKAWIYLTIGKIYGEAVWFDDPLTEKKDLSEFPVKNIREIVVACKSLLTDGFDGVGGQLEMTWKEWLDPDTETGSSPYQLWDYMTPEYFALWAELCLWNGDYQETVNILLSTMNAKFESTTSTSVDWLLNDMNQGKHNVMWNTSKISDYRPHIVSVISYDYTKNQTNSLLKHFGTEYPNQYLLAPSDSGMYRYADPKFNNLGTLQEDPRAGHNFKKDSGGKYYICKYRTEGSSARVNPYQDDVHIFIYRAADLYFMLAEALNNLGRYAEASALINYGVSGTFSSGGVTWEGFSDAWTKDWDGGNRSYADTGIRGGKIGVGKRPFPGDTKGNDLAILNEIMLEQPCEGRTLPAMIRMAMRYDDYNIIADRVCPKYTNPGDIRAKILSGGYFIHWDLKITE